MRSEVFLGIRVDQINVEVFLVLVVGDSSVVIELVENVFLTALVIGTAVCNESVLIVIVFNERAVMFRALGDSSENSGFRNRQILDILAEVTDSSELDTVDRTAETDVVQVFFKYLILCIGFFKLHRTENFSYLTLRRMLVITCEVFDELLSDS